MHRHQTPQPSAQVDGAIPLSKWTQHRAENGLVYLSHPRTHEVKWLWSRHRDPHTSKDYLVNTVTGERHWVTPENQHLCPVKLDSSIGSIAAPSNSNSHMNSDNRHQQQYPQRDPRQPHAQSFSQETPARHQLLQDQQQRKEQQRLQSLHKQNYQQKPLPELKQKQQNWHEKLMNARQQKPQFQPPSNNTISDTAVPSSKPIANGAHGHAAHNYGGGWPSRTRVEPDPTPTATTTAAHHQKDLNSPQGSVPQNSDRRHDQKQPADRNGSTLGLNEDEVLMNVPETGRRYVYNKRTKRSRWLSGDATGEMPRVTKPNSPSNPPIANQPTSEPTINDDDTALKFSNIKLSAGPGKSEEQGSGGEEKHESTQDGVKKHNTTTEDGVTAKLQNLNALLQDVEQVTSSGKFDMRVFRQISDKQGEKGDTKDAPSHEVAQRLLELAEYLTQQMLKVDAVESDGNALVRGKRKEVVNKILTLADEVEKLRGIVKN